MLDDHQMEHGTSSQQNKNVTTNIIIKSDIPLEDVKKRINLLEKNIDRLSPGYLVIFGLIGSALIAGLFFFMAAMLK